MIGGNHFLGRGKKNFFRGGIFWRGAKKFFFRGE